MASSKLKAAKTKMPCGTFFESALNPKEGNLGADLEPKEIEQIVEKLKAIIVDKKKVRDAKKTAAANADAAMTAEEKMAAAEKEKEKKIQAAEAERKKREEEKKAAEEEERKVVRSLPALTTMTLCRLN